MKGDLEQCLAVGMDDYLSKPFTHSQLNTVLSRWLSSPSRAGSSNPSPAPKPAQGRIDFTAWDTIRGLQREGRPDLLARAMTTYLENSRQLVDTLRRAVSAHDAIVVHQAAHSLKSSSATLGAVALAALSKDLEAAGRTEALGEAMDLLRRLEAEYLAVREVFSAELKKGDR